VTHGANILALTGLSPASGELVVVTAGKDRALRVVGTLQAPRLAAAAAEVPGRRHSHVRR
jgi:hypothetical protein